MDNWNELKAGLTAGRITRRAFMSRAAALGISAALAGSIVSRTAMADTPKRGGHLILGLNGAGATDSLDPSTYTATHMQVVGHQLYNTLAEVDAHNAVQPVLAESWEAKPGAKEWVFKIRKGVTFSNGKALTAADVVHTFNHHRKPDSKSAAKSLLTPAVDIKATDTHEVTFTLSSGNADMPYLVADYHICIGPEGSSFTDGIGTGPFILESLQPGVKAVTKRNPNYWRTDRAFVDSVETLAINDDTARISALLSGSVHLINRVDPKTVKLLAGNKRVQVFEISGGAHYTFPMRCDVAPFNNNELRLALKYAVDRQSIIRRVLLGHGKIGNDIPVPGFDPFYAADIPQRPYDPDKAKFHFKKSGHDGPLVLTVSNGAFTGAVDSALLIQASAAKAGITVQIERTPADGYWDDVWLKKAWCASYWDGRPTADMMMSVVYKSDAPWNESYWKREDFDKLLVIARAELDQSKRKQMYHDLQMMIYDDCGEIIPMFNNTIDAGSTKVKGFVQRPSLQLAGYRAPETVWLES